MVRSLPLGGKHDLFGLGLVSWFIGWTLLCRDADDSVELSPTMAHFMQCMAAFFIWLPAYKIPGVKWELILGVGLTVLFGWIARRAPKLRQATVRFSNRFYNQWKRSAVVLAPSSYFLLNNWLSRLIIRALITLGLVIFHWFTNEDLTEPSKEKSNETPPTEEQKSKVADTQRQVGEAKALMKE